MRRRTIIIIVVSILLIGGGVAWYFSTQQGQTVEQIFVEQNDVLKTVSASGVVKSDDQADLSFLASGKITNINIEEGQQVIARSVLGSLNTTSQAQTSQASRDARDIALRSRDAFIEQYSSNKDDIGGDEAYEIELRRQNELVSQAQASLNAQLSLLPNYYINAPFAGTVTNVNKKVGETATAGEPVFTIADLSKLYFQVELDQEDYGFVRLDQPVNITFDSYPDDTFTGKIIDLPDYVGTNGTSGVVTVKISIDPIENKPVLLGMTGDVDIIVDKVDMANTLIFDEIIEDDTGTYVWVLGAGKLKKLPIETGVEGDIYTEVKTDLSSYTIVIPSETGQELKEGEQAKIVKEK